MTVRRQIWRIVRCLIVVALAYCLVMPVVYSLMAWHFARELARENPVLRSAPQPEADHSIAVLNGVTVNHFGCSFQVPWSKADTEREMSGIATVHFKEDYGLLFFNPATQVNALDVLRHSKDGTKALRVLGLDELTTNYAFTSMVLHTVPQEASLWALTTKNTRVAVMLGNKLMLVGNRPNPIYEVAFGTMRGFEIDRSTSTARTIGLELFDPRDRRISLMLTAPQQAQWPIPQPQINAIIQSMSCPVDIKTSPANG